jgi:hypothetical protein
VGKGPDYIVEVGTLRAEKVGFRGGHLFEILHQRGGDRLSLLGLELGGLRGLLDAIDAEERQAGASGVALVERRGFIKPSDLWKFQAGAHQVAAFRRNA